MEPTRFPEWVSDMVGYPGGMQASPLNVIGLLRHAELAHPQVPVISHLSGEAVFDGNYTTIARRVRQLARALIRLGVKPGDRVATLAWNTNRHVELMYAVPGLGAILHTANPRLFAEQIAYVLNHGGSRILFVDASFLPLLDAMAGQLEAIDTLIVLGTDTAACARRGIAGRHESGSLRHHHALFFALSRYRVGYPLYRGDQRLRARVARRPL